MTLVTEGIFGFMRNPMYTAMMVFIAGIAIALGSDWTLVLVVPAALILHFEVMKREGQYLEQNSERDIALTSKRSEAIGFKGQLALDHSPTVRTLGAHSGSLGVSRICVI